MESVLNPFIAGLFGLLSFFGQAQTVEDNSKYIEVTVTDSVELTPDRIEYFMMFRKKDYSYETAVEVEDYNNTGTSTDYLLETKKKEEEEKLKQKANEKKIIDLLTKEKISYTRQADDSYLKYLYMNDKENPMRGFNIKFKSIAEMEMFISKIPEDIRYDGNVLSATSTKTLEAEDMIINRAIKRAEEKARRIAATSGVKLGTVIQFTDSEGENLVSGFERLMLTIPRMYDKKMQLKGGNKIIVMKTIRVRYSIQ